MLNSMKLQIALASIYVVIDILDCKSLADWLTELKNANEKNEI